MRRIEGVCQSIHLVARSLYARSGTSVGMLVASPPGGDDVSDLLYRRPVLSTLRADPCGSRVHGAPIGRHESAAPRGGSPRRERNQNWRGRSTERDPPQGYGKVRAMFPYATMVDHTERSITAERGRGWRLKGERSLHLDFLRGVAIL